MNFAKEYIEKLKEGLDKLDTETVEKIVDTLLIAMKNKKQIFIVGNGGSAATASHMACDLGKGTLKKIYDPSEERFRVISLTDNTPLLTALSNDVGYENVFSQQLTNLISRGDVLIAISGSGNSENVIRAIELAQNYKAIIIGILGSDGGKIKNLTDYCLIYDEKHYGRIEDAGSVLSHLICSWVKEKLKETKGDGEFFKEVTGKSSIFLDRDGIINKNAAEHDYIKTLDEFEFIPNSKNAIINLAKRGHQIFIISNQAGINKGLIKKEDLEKIENHIQNEVGYTVTKNYYCPHKPEENCECRKPKPGMLLQAAKEYSLNLKDCYYIGDSKDDVIAAKLAGCKMIFVLTGRGEQQIKDKFIWEHQPDAIAENLYKASELILEGKI
ncbi:MAG: HAD-IIIA family hydrolase [Candidatus Pacearchaeota archaeon]|nr:HAD-IIIA family hydrolase [Candidatus Pacearchaeota archaeon]